MNKIKKNYIYNLIYQVFSLITPLIVTPHVSRALGSSGVGQYAFTFSIVTYFVLFAALGFNTYAQREIARNQNNKETQSLVFWEIIIARFVSVLVSVIVYFSIFLFGVYGESYNILILILSLNIIAVAFDVSFLFQGNENFGIIAIRNVVIKVIGVVLILLFVKNKNDVWLYTLIQSLIVVISNFTLWTSLPKVLTRIKIKDLNVKRHYLPTFKLFVPTIAISVYTVLDRTLIGVMIPGLSESGERIADIESGYYEQSEKLVKMALTIITSLGAVMIPRNSNAIASGNIDEFNNNINGAIRFVFFIGTPIMFGLAAIALNLSPWFFGDGYEKVPYLMMMFSPLVLIIGLSNVLGIQYLLPLKKDFKYTIAITSGAIFNLILNVALIPFLKSYGACVATIIAEIIVLSIMFIFAKKDVSFKKMMIVSWKYLVSGFFMFAIVFATQHFLTPSILHTLLLIAEGVFCYFAFLCLLRDSTTIGLLKKYVFVKKEKTNASRDASLDLLKIIACFGVVVLHTINKDSGPLNKFLYYIGTASIPLFFIVDGALLLNKKDDITFRYCFKKIARVLILAFFWSLIGFAYVFIVNGDLSKWYLHIFGWVLQKGQSYHLWFFASLIIVYLALPLLHKISKNKVLNTSSIVFLFLCCTVFYVINIVFSKQGNILLTKNIPQFARIWEHWLYFLIGGWLYKTKNRFEEKQLILIVFACLSFTIITTMSYFSSYFLEDKGAEYNYCMPLIIVLVAIFFVCVININVNRVASSISKPCTGVYLIHLYVFAVLNKFMFAPFELYLIAPTLVFLTSFFVSWIALHVRFVNNLFKL